MDSLTMDIKAALENYRCRYSVDSEGDGVALVDVISPNMSKTIKWGLLEVDMLAEHIAGELFHRNHG